MSERTFTIEMIDMDLADLDTDEFLGLTPTYLRSILLELKRCYEELDRPKVTIDDWDKEGPCVTVYLEGKEYVGILREYDASE
jgi:hypothetical protein